MSDGRRLTVLVCGGREYVDLDHVYRVLDEVRPTRVVCGGATGADSLAESWADDRGVDKAVYPADWEKYGRRAGVIRNAEMLIREEVDLVVAFPGGKGTSDMVSRAVKRGIAVQRSFMFTPH